MSNRDLMGVLISACNRADIHVDLLLDRILEEDAAVEREHLAELADMLRQAAARLDQAAIVPVTDVVSWIPIEPGSPRPIAG